VNLYIASGNSPVVQNDPSGLQFGTSFGWPPNAGPYKPPTMGHIYPALYPEAGDHDIFCNLNCILCSRAITKRWVSNPNGPGGSSWRHNCNSGYSHCMACCTLSKFAGTLCAKASQNMQNRIYNRGEAKANVRKTQCDSGLKAANNGKDCHSACSSIYNDWEHVGDPHGPKSPYCQRMFHRAKTKPNDPIIGFRFPNLSACTEPDIYFEIPDR